MASEIQPRPWSLPDAASPESFSLHVFPNHPLSSLHSRSGTPCQSPPCPPSTPPTLAHRAFSSAASAPPASPTPARSCPGRSEGTRAKPPSSRLRASPRLSLSSRTRSLTRPPPRNSKNVILDPPSILLMDSGAYTISEYICRTCETYLGWKFVRALDGPERWKEGHFILELDLVDEEDDAGDERYMEGQSSPLSRIDEEPHPRMPTHKRTQSGTVHPPPKAAREGLRSLQAGPKKTAASRRRNLDDDDDDYDGKPFWKPR
ncbi:hypothetical protein C8Q78DRAFT_613684 [Trametes maxima]|nr:hypothetical protein C8Q78DRAFT_613684 [Trametes maxima]